MQHGPFRVSCHDLPRRAGEMRQMSLTFDKHERLGIDVLGVEKDSPIDVELTLQSVNEGVLVSGTVSALVIGECTRCLDPIEFDVEESFQELFRYEEEKKSHKHEKEIDVKDEDEELHMDGEFVDLEFPIRDALILDLPINPLCDEECEGLCPDCGARMADLPEDHSHEKHDIRWSALEDLAAKLKSSTQAPGESKASEGK